MVLYRAERGVSCSEDEDEHRTFTNLIAHALQEWLAGSKRWLAGSKR
jgi:hypothetical protein